MTGNYYPLLVTSPAIGAGDAAHCTAADQRGESRPQPAGSNCDIGAYEETTRAIATATFTASPTETLTPSATATSTATPTATQTPTATATRVRVDIIVDADCPLPAAVIAANTDSNSHDTDCEAGVGDDIIILPAGKTTTLSATLNITDNLTINGNGHIISGNDAVRVMSATANLALNNVTIRDGMVSSSTNGAGLQMANTSTTVTHTLSINNSAFLDNNAMDDGEGGALDINFPGQVTIRNSTFSGNSANNGAAIYMYTHG